MKTGQEEIGYAEFCLIDTTDAIFIDKKEAAWPGLGGMTLWIRRK